VFDALCVLAVAFVPDDGFRIISLRPAKGEKTRDLPWASKVVVKSSVQNARGHAARRESLGLATGATRANDGSEAVHADSDLTGEGASPQGLKCAARDARLRFPLSLRHQTHRPAPSSFFTDSRS
jgi:hypothetical protein